MLLVPAFLLAVLAAPAAPASGGSDVKTLKKACDDGALADCVALGQRYERGRGVAQDPLYASLAYRQACDGGNAEGCFHLGVMHERGAGRAVEHDLTAATELFQKSCKAGHSPACEKIEGYVARAEAPPSDAKLGPAVPVGPKAGAKKAACADGDLDACYADAIALHFGEGVAKDRKRARRLLDETCDKGHQAACDSLKALAPDDGASN